ncbi:MAG: PepSY-associated TM helix domain-containing protein [Burkholderiaceae bacterium]|nr:PepSY-associated TM helix domain-containing protein [Burkholderiaceae bacterium]
MQAGNDSGRRAYWLKTLHTWHWISSALCLLGMLLFSITGITLNHAGSIEAKPQVTTHAGQLPDALEQLMREQALRGDKAAALPAPVQAWVREQWQVTPGDRAAEWSEEEAYLSMPRPGGDAWLRISLEDGQVEYESTDRGWVSYFNDLHKGRHTGVAWSWFIDIFAVAALLFSITGLFILQMHAAKRPLTWPMVGMGVVIPLLLAMLFIH